MDSYFEQLFPLWLRVQNFLRIWKKLAVVKYKMRKVIADNASGAALATGFGKAGAQMLDQVLHQGICNWVRLQTPQAVSDKGAQFFLGDVAEPSVAVKIHEAALSAKTAERGTVIILSKTSDDSQEMGLVRQAVERIGEVADLLLMLPASKPPGGVVWEG